MRASRSTAIEERATCRRTAKVKVRPKVPGQLRKQIWASVEPETRARLIRYAKTREPKLNFSHAVDELLQEALARHEQRTR